MNTNYDVPADPHFEAPRRGEWGGDIRREECPDCDGQGAFPDFDVDLSWPDYVECEKCHGTGYVEYEDLPEPSEREE
jgi:DnaJ-class molecular chaperone